MARVFAGATAVPYPQGGQGPEPLSMINESWVTCSGRGTREFVRGFAGNLPLILADHRYSLYLADRVFFQGPEAKKIIKKY